MVTVTTIIIAGGIFWSGKVAFQQLRSSEKWLRPLTRNHVEPPVSSVGSASATVVSPVELAAGTDNEALERANHFLTLSSLSLALTTGGLLFKSALMFVSVPVGLLVFAPTFRAAWRALWRERRVTTPVVDATRITLCVIMGYYFALALDAWLRTITQRLLVRTAGEFTEVLDHYFVQPAAGAWRFTAGAEIQIALPTLAIDDVIRVDVGELVPVSGTVLYGVAWVEERIVTGELALTRKTVGELISADTTVVMGQIYLRVTAIPEELATVAIQEGLYQTIATGTLSQQMGEAVGQYMAPRMLAIFGILLPFWNANRAAGFLTTSFGTQMAALGPHTLNIFVNLAAQQQILVLDGRALEKLTLINTLVIDAHLLMEPAARVQAHNLIRALRNRRWLTQAIAPQPFAVYLVADGRVADAHLLQQWAAAVGADDAFLEPLATARIALLTRLRTAGSVICHLGAGHEDVRVLEKALVTVALPSTTDALTKMVAEKQIQIVLLEKNLERLGQLFDVAAQFAAKQRFNLAWPLLMDVVDLATTIFFHMGLTYSILFSYSGLLLSAINAKLPLMRYQREQVAAGQDRLLPLPKRNLSP